ncbi:MAG: helix-turn-helix protein [Tenericutes bacterium ADurb.BinA155]|jgi:transcriptional regulator with XRE-family HTH domain|nr:MAG: helix-turn-helix protein [Tenericutes bacterium ADurb.BinA155]
MKEKKNAAYGAALKAIRKGCGITQKDFALRSGLGLHYVRDIEQGASSLRLDKVNEAFHFFGYTLTPTKEKKDL